MDAGTVGGMGLMAIVVLGAADLGFAGAGADAGAAAAAAAAAVVYSSTAAAAYAVPAFLIFGATALQSSIVFTSRHS